MKKAGPLSEKSEQLNIQEEHLGRYGHCQGRPVHVSEETDCVPHLLFVHVLCEIPNTLNEKDWLGKKMFPQVSYLSENRLKE